MATKSSSSKAKNRVKSTRSFPLALRVLKEELSIVKRKVGWLKKDLAWSEKNAKKDETYKVHVKMFTKMLSKQLQDVEQLNKAIAKLS